MLCCELLLVIISTETKLISVVYSSVSQQLQNKSTRFLLKDLLPLSAIADNPVTLPQGNRNKNIQMALRKHLLTEQPEKSTHTPNTQTCRRSFQHPIVPELQSVTLHANFFCYLEEGPLLLVALVLVVFFLSDESLCRPLTKIIRAELTIDFYMAVFGSIRLTWNSVNTTSLCVYMRVYERQGVSVSSGWFSCR